MKITLYGFFPYDRSAKARWLLTEMGVTFTDHWLDRDANENEQAAYLAINPAGRSPSIVIDDLKFFESSAICAYLADRFLDRGMAPALESAERAAYQQWMYFAAATLDPVQTQMMIIEDIPAGEVHSEKMEKLTSEFSDSLTALDLAIQAGPFLAGNRFSTADICNSYPLYFAGMWPELQAVIDRYPRVTEYLSRMKAMRSAVQAAVFSFPE